MSAPYASLRDARWQYETIPGAGTRAWEWPYVRRYEMRLELAETDGERLAAEIALRCHGVRVVARPEGATP